MVDNFSVWLQLSTITRGAFVLLCHKSSILVGVQDDSVVSIYPLSQGGPFQTFNVKMITTHEKLLYYTIHTYR